MIADALDVTAANGYASPPGGSVSSSAPRRICAWCPNEIAGGKRRDALFCSTRCRQASHRFHVERATSRATDRSMRFAYADPPYPGKAGLYPERQEVDHASLLERLTAGWPDGWALSTSASALAGVLRLCPPEVRVCAWFKGPRRTRARRALSSWEPLIVAGGRPLRVDVVKDLTDGLIAQGRHRAFPGALVGMKPPAFCEWMFRQLGAVAGDELDDLFPGSGAVGVAWGRHTSLRDPRDASHLQGTDASREYSADASRGDDGLRVASGGRETRRVA